MTPFGRFRRRWEENTVMDFKEIRVITRNWNDSALDMDYRRTLANAELNLQVL